jgi:hypothetical protein
MTSPGEKDPSPIFTEEREVLDADEDTVLRDIGGVVVRLLIFGS